MFIVTGMTSSIVQPALAYSAFYALQAAGIKNNYRISPEAAVNIKKIKGHGSAAVINYYDNYWYSRCT